MPGMSARTLLIAVSGMSLLGCGGSAGQVGFTTGVSGSTPLNRLTSGQATQLCNDVTRENTTTFEPMLCASWSHSGALITTGAYFGQPLTATDADLQTECASLLTFLYPSGCIPAVTCDAAGLASNPPSCTATVADVADCLNGNYALEKELLAATPACDVLTASSLTAYVAPGGPYDRYTYATTSARSASCSALLDCAGIYPINETSPGS